MIDASVQTNVKSKPILPLSTALGPVHIAVTDRSKALAIWQDVVGLDLISETGNELALGAGGNRRHQALRAADHRALSRCHPCA